MEWNQAANTPVNFIVELQVDTSFTHDEEDAIRTAIADYFKEYSLIGGVTVYSRLFAAVVDAAPDGFIENFYMSTSATPGPTDVVDLTANFWEVYTVGTIGIQYGS